MDKSKVSTKLNPRIQGFDKAQPKNPKSKIEFEEALSQLEAIVEKLEGGDTSLEEALKSFEEGVRISRICLKILDEAEKRIEILSKGEGGEIQTLPFKVESAPDEQ